MGSPLSLIMANLFIENLKGRPVESACLKPTKCRHPKIKLILKIVDNQQSPFLDVIVDKKKTNRYLNPKSHHQPAQLQMVVKTLGTRSQELADTDSPKHEMNIPK